MVTTTVHNDNEAVSHTTCPSEPEDKNLPTIIVTTKINALLHNTLHR